MGNLISRPEEEEELLFLAHLADWLNSRPPPENEEPLVLTALPQELVHSIVSKLEYEDLAKLEETCKTMATVLNNCDFSLRHSVETILINKKTTNMTRYYAFYDRVFDIRRIPWHVATSGAARIHADVVEISCRATTSRLKAAAKLFEKNKTTAVNLRIMEHVTFDPEGLDRLINVLKVAHMECRQFLPREFFMNPEEGLNKLYGVSLFTNGCTDEELLKLKVLFLHMTNDFITDRGLNRFLKQWKKRERDIVWFSMDIGGTFGTRNFDTILQGLDANPIWTPDLHEHSLVGAIKLEDFALMQTGDPEHLYSLWSPDFPEDIRLISLSQGRFEVTMLNNEEYTLNDYLDEDQFYEAWKICRWCELQFCCHRRWYSMQRFKKFYPRVNDFIIIGVKAISNIFFAVRCVQLLLGADSSHSHLVDDDVKRIHFEEQANTSWLNTLIYNLRVHLLKQ